MRDVVSERYELDRVVYVPSQRDPPDAHMAQDDHVNQRFEVVGGAICVRLRRWIGTAQGKPGQRLHGGALISDRRVNSNARADLIVQCVVIDGARRVL